MGINDLPKPGIKFKATLGPGSFKRKLSNLTRYGDFRNVRDNQDKIVKIVRKYQRPIRMDKFSRLRQRDAWLKIKASDKTLTKEDRRETKLILKYLGGGSAGDNKLDADETSVKASDGKSYLTDGQIKKNLRSRMQRDELTREKSEMSFAGGRVSRVGIGQEATRRIKGTSGDIGVGMGITTDFAANNNSKLSNNSAPKSVPGGVKPIIKLVT